MGQEHDQQRGASRESRPRRKFSEEFKRDAVDMVLSTGRPIAHVAKELGLYDSTLGNWVCQAQVDAGKREGTTTEDAARIRHLEAELAKVKSERDLLKRSVAFWVNETSVTCYRCVEARKAEGFDVTAACAVMEVSTSAYYDWRARGALGLSERVQRDERVMAEIRSIHRDHPDDGSPRVAEELSRRGEPANHKKVETTMATNGIVARRHRRRRCLTKPDETAPPVPDLVGRLFDPDDVDHTWVGDVTCVPTDEGWLYLASVIDLGSRRLLGYSMSDRADTAPVVNAVEMAVAARGRTRWTARSSTPTADRPTPRPATQQRCVGLGLRQSVARTGSCLDNAVAEAWFATLEKELGRRHYRTRAEARRAIFAWVNYYNFTRLHSACGMRPPVEYEQLLAAPPEPAATVGRGRMNPVSGPRGEVHRSPRTT